VSTGEGEGQEIPPWVLTPPEGGARGSHRREGQDALSNLSSHSGLPSRVSPAGPQAGATARGR
jgi:hypothetical protein